jgi:hypothetical protein
VIERRIRRQRCNRLHAVVGDTQRVPTCRLHAARSTVVEYNPRFWVTCWAGKRRVGIHAEAVQAGAEAKIEAVDQLVAGIVQSHEEPPRTPRPNVLAKLIEAPSGAAPATFDTRTFLPDHHRVDRFTVSP